MAAPSEPWSSLRSIASLATFQSVRQDSEPFAGRDGREGRVAWELLRTLLPVKAPACVPRVLRCGREGRPGQTSKFGLCAVDGLVADLRPEGQPLGADEGDVRDADEAEHGAQVRL